MKFVTDIIGEELNIFEKKFAGAVKSSTPLLDRIMKYIIKRKGKQMRPMFVFLSAKLHGTINESTYRAAALVELLHTATLVHDDVVDESLEITCYPKAYFYLLPIMILNTCIYFPKP